MIKRRLGAHSFCCSRRTCPNVFELNDGNFAVVGTDMTDELRAHLPPDAGCGDGERIVIVPRAVMTSAKHDIPDATL